MLLYSMILTAIIFAFFFNAIQVIISINKLIAKLPTFGLVALIVATIVLLLKYQRFDVIDFYRRMVIRYFVRNLLILPIAYFLTTQ